jgi:hypothetical protein
MKIVKLMAIANPILAILNLTALVFVCPARMEVSLFVVGYFVCGLFVCCFGGVFGGVVVVFWFSFGGILFFCPLPLLICLRIFFLHYLFSLSRLLRTSNLTGLLTYLFHVFHWSSSTSF